MINGMRYMFGIKYKKNATTLQLAKDKCIGCCMCVKVCPNAVFKVINKKEIIIDKNLIVVFGACSINFPEGAITVKTGVGCATAVITSILTKLESNCDC